jgi:hypothetical protein
MKIKKVTLSDSRLSYNESGESTTFMIRDKHYLEEDEDKDTVLSMYEDQCRKQPKDIDIEYVKNDVSKNDIIIETKKSDCKKYDNKFKGFKSKESNISWRTNDVPTESLGPKSKILL